MMELQENSWSFEDSADDSQGDSGFEDSGADSFESFAESFPVDSSFDSLFESVAASLFELLVAGVSKFPDRRKLPAGRETCERLALSSLMSSVVGVSVGASEDAAAFESFAEDRGGLLVLGWGGKSLL